MSNNPQTGLTDPVQAMLAQAALKHTLFEPMSRYYGIDIAMREEGGTTVVDGERVDNIAARHFGDSTLFWRLCDANNALRPAALTEVPGRRLRITLPEGINGTVL
jgi:hypothetical protein